MPCVCPNCGAENLVEFLSEESVRLEAVVRAQFVLDRTEKTPGRTERKDLTDFAHGASARLLECGRCSILVRDESKADPVETYVEDAYDPTAMERLLPSYVEAFRNREEPYRALLNPGAEVLEIGPHLGAFLQVATEWGWKPVGVDVGKDTTRFVNEHGYVTYNQTIEDSRFPDAYFDGAFVWNCFEQIPDPARTLDEIHRIVKPGGPLVLRTPNALFYSVCERFLRSRDPGEVSNWVMRALGYNNLLAFPYLYGYTDSILSEMAIRHRFVCESAINSELITLPFPDLQEWVIEENRATTAALHDWSELQSYESKGGLTGPWMEIAYRSI
jgi:SAM-dependent methyltransferase